MRKKFISRGVLSLMILVHISVSTHAQTDSLKIFAWDSTKFANLFAGPFSISFRDMPAFNEIYHHAEEADDSIYKELSYLVDEEPDSSNYVDYYNLACTLWNLEKVVKAEKMFLAIIRSKLKVFNKAHWSSSDIPGDTSSNIYGYGSASYHYKNDAAIFLTKIYLEQRKFNHAYYYLQQAVNKYPVERNCGTGYHYLKEKYDYLSASCYLGLKQYNKVVSLLMPECFERDHLLLAEALRKMHSAAMLHTSLLNAEKTMLCYFDKERSYSYTERTDDNDSVISSDTSWYYSGHAVLQLFGQKITITPSDLEDGQRVSREYFINYFRKSSFYRRLMKEKDDGFSYLN